MTEDLPSRDKEPGVAGPGRRCKRPYRHVNQCSAVPQYGRICREHRKINLSVVITGQIAGIRGVADSIRLVSFWDFDLGFFNEEAGQVKLAPKPLTPEVRTIYPV
jgi:hypothetical protein